jgi:hypothetical protein
MNRLKFIVVPVDEAAHNEFHTLIGAERLVDGMRCNWVHLIYNWGFPRETKEDELYYPPFW